MKQDWSGGKPFLKRSKGGAGRLRPDVGTQRGGEVSEGSSYTSVVPDESPIEIGETQETL